MALVTTTSIFSDVPASDYHTRSNDTANNVEYVSYVPTSLFDFPADMFQEPGLTAYDSPVESE